MKPEEIDKVARTFYSRFYHTYGLQPQWTDSNKIQRVSRLIVSRVLDCLSLAGYKVVPMNENEERLPQKCNGQE